MNPYRRDFPIFDTSINGHPLVYLDNAATMQMPRPVMEAMMLQQSSCDPGDRQEICTFSELSALKTDAAREHIAHFIGAESASEIIFTSGTTAGINIAARSFIDTFLQPGEELISTQMEHHSNYLPWRETSPDKQGVFISCPVDRNGDLDMDAFSSLLSKRTLIVSVSYISNVTGAVNPVRDIIRKAHNAGAAVLLDCAQAMRYTKIDVRELDCDFCVFSGHKIGGPAGTGILYGKSEMLELMKPVLYGGNTVRELTDRVTAYEDVPYRFEPGTPNTAGIIGLDAAVSYLENIGVENISKAEKDLLTLTEEILSSSDRIKILGKPKERAGAISFNIDGLASSDVAKQLIAQGIAVGCGHHCALPLHQAFGITESVRVSPAFCNSLEEIEQFGTAIERILADPGKG